MFYYSNPLSRIQLNSSKKGHQFMNSTRRDRTASGLDVLVNCFCYLRFDNLARTLFGFVLFMIFLAWKPKFTMV